MANDLTSPEEWLIELMPNRDWIKYLGVLKKKEAMPAYCFASLESLERVLPTADEINSGLAPDYPLGSGALLTIGTWAYSKGIYKIDPLLFDELYKMPIPTKIPTDVLLRLPEYSVYVDLRALVFNMTWTTNGGGSQRLFGFWATVTYQPSTKSPLLIVHLNYAIPLATTYALDLSKSDLHAAMTMGLIYSEMDCTHGDNADIGVIGILLNVLLYICSDEPDIENDKEEPIPKLQPKSYHSRRYGTKYLQAQATKTYSVGKKTGELLEQFKNTKDRDTSCKKRPHMRRAHWHGFWKGKRDGVRTFYYKWLPPRMVASPLEHVK